MWVATATTKPNRRWCKMNKRWWDVGKSKVKQRRQDLSWPSCAKHSPLSLVVAEATQPQPDRRHRLTWRSSKWWSWVVVVLVAGIPIRDGTSIPLMNSRVTCKSPVESGMPMKLQRWRVYKILVGLRLGKPWLWLQSVSVSQTPRTKIWNDNQFHLSSWKRWPPDSTRLKMKWRCLRETAADR